ncbi:sugar transporter [Sphingobacterium sp. ML3W]|nr:sugar transporter [Sphingobacterium sp. ML3W]
MQLKKILLLITSVILTITASFGQIHKPVKWTVASKKINSKEAVLFVKATIQNGWHIYALNLNGDGPIPTSFSFQKSADFSLIGKTLEPSPKVKHEKVFKMDVGYFINEVVFQQKVKLNNDKGVANARGIVKWQSCDATQCLPQEEYAFIIPVK